MTARFAPAVVLRTSWPFDSRGFVLRSPMPEPSSARCIGDWLVRWATEAPDRAFLAERAGTAWRRVSYGEALGRVRRLAQALLDAGLGPAAPLAILSGNSIDHALLALAAMHVGVPVAPVSPAYSLASQDHGKLRALVGALAPGAIWAEGVAFDRAFAALGVQRFEIAEAEPTSAVDDAFARITPATIAKILFTSGSTGTPKGVVNTHRMLCANQAAIAAGWPFLDDRPPVIVDWLPWSHTFGANHNFNMILAHGGTLCIDAGKPAPGAFDTTLANLREVPSTLYFNVPRGFDMLVGALETDDVLRETFFRDLDIVFYAAAALSPATWDRLAAVARRAGKQPAMVSAWGSTETSPLVTQVHFPIDRAGVIGLPAPGLTLAFVPSGDKLEMRVKGPSVTPGYWIAGGGIEPAPRDPHGFYPMGDAGRLADEHEPARGVVFDGRTAENFKLSSGTWVHVGELRIALVAACSPFVADAVITGHDRDEVGALVFAAPGHVIDDRELAEGLARCNATREGSAARIVRARVLREPPSIDHGEITDKGYLNQRAVLARRAAEVEALYAGDCVVVADGSRT
ncbi:MAG TPA: feruloyl-CoA synthase [Kofleriaceae bacterium]|nr:feruloyl-CoA synthase [Kofleriaceae bacterium]